MRKIEGHAAVFAGDIVSVYSEALRVGRISIAVEVLVDGDRWSAGRFDRAQVTEAGEVLLAIASKREATRDAAPAASSATA